MINTQISELGLSLLAWSFSPLTDEEVETEVNQKHDSGWKVRPFSSFYSNGTYSWILKKGNNATHRRKTNKAGR